MEVFLEWAAERLGQAGLVWILVLPGAAYLVAVLTLLLFGGGEYRRLCRAARLMRNNADADLVVRALPALCAAHTEGCFSLSTLKPPPVRHMPALCAALAVAAALFGGLAARAAVSNAAAALFAALLLVAGLLPALIALPLLRAYKRRAERAAFTFSVWADGRREMEQNDTEARLRREVLNADPDGKNRTRGEAIPDGEPALYPPYVFEENDPPFEDILTRVIRISDTGAPLAEMREIAALIQAARIRPENRTPDRLRQLSQAYTKLLDAVGAVAGNS